MDRFILPPPTGEQALLLAQLSRALSAVAGNVDAVTLHVEETIVDVPPVAVGALIRALAEMAHGRGVEVRSYPPELTVEHAMDLLGVSAARLSNCMNDGSLPSHGSGTNRRIYFADLCLFRNRMREQQGAAADALLRLLQPPESPVG